MLFYGLVVSFFSVAAAQCWRNTACNGPKTAAFPGSWDTNNYAPSTRIVTPTTFLTWPDLKPSAYKEYTLSKNGSLVTYDFGKEVGGIARLSYSSTGSGRLGLAFTEAKNWIGEWSDSSNGKHQGPDGAVYSTFSGGQVNYVMPDEVLRGGFRYLTVFLISNGNNASVTLGKVECEIAFMPTWPNMQAYQGYFDSSDALLNRIWYAGAYTLQTNIVPTNTGRQVPMLTVGWANNATLGPGDNIIVDGAKRDRAVWPGDMGIAVPSTFVSVGDLESIKNALQVMYDHQASNGAFDESGPPLSQKSSDTYHMWSMIGTYNYVLYTNDLAFLNSNWAKYLKAMTFVLNKVDSSGLMNVTGIRDWARWQQGGHNTEANMILYHTLTTGSRLAQWSGSSGSSYISEWQSRAASLQVAINKLTWDSTTGTFRDNDTMTALHPQDANSIALYFNATASDRFSSVSSGLTKNWTPIGPASPELGHNISPFITSFELSAHVKAREVARAFKLMREMWGWILNNPNSTQSTFIEGYLTDGSFGYRDDRGYAYDTSYTSHAHGWSAGPTSVLTTGILGLDVEEPAGSVWSITPQPGDLTRVEGGFTTPLGKFSAKYQGPGSNSTVAIKYRLSWNTPTTSKGHLILSAPAAGTVLEIDGNPVQSYRTINLAGKSAIDISVEGGAHELVVK